MAALHAQKPFIIRDATDTPSVHVWENSAGYVGIGITDPSIAAFMVCNRIYSTPPTALMAAVNRMPGTILEAGASQFSMLALRTDSGMQGRAVDFVVDQNGYVGMGNFPGTTAHLYLTDPDESGTVPLMSAVSNQGSQSLFVAADGNVGIGTTTPSALFTATNVNTTSAPTILAEIDNTKFTLLDSSLGVMSVNSVSPYAESSLIVKRIATQSVIHGSTNTVGLTDLIVNNVGNVGIGIASPKAKLDVQGFVRIGNVTTPDSLTAGGYSLYVQYGVMAEKFKCALKTTSDWSDYVFDKEYTLAPLSDVEQYIKVNKHLPGVPSAEEVHCEGIDMAQMDATLLKKIEELTLYILDLKKENEQMKREIKNIKKETK